MIKEVELLRIELTPEQTQTFESLLKESGIKITWFEIKQFRANLLAALEKKNTFESSIRQAIDGLLTSRKLFQALFEIDTN
jgi:hypothetical protein